MRYYRKFLYKNLEVCLNIRPDKRYQLWGRVYNPTNEMFVPFYLDYPQKVRNIIQAIRRGVILLRRHDESNKENA
jgi:hypothetical protein